MTNQPSLFDSNAGQQLRAAGEQQALDHAPEEWIERARLAIRDLAASGEDFTSEDVIARAGLPRNAIAMNHNNAVGALVGAASRRGTIVKTGRYVPSRRPRSHGAALAVWVGMSGYERTAR